MGRVDAVILASGLSRRMGCNKLLLPLGGSTVLDQFLSGFPYALFENVIVVHGEGEVAAIARRYPVVLCHNQKPEAGKSHSIQLGLSVSTAEDGILFAVADQPLLTGGVIARLIEMFYKKKCQKIIVPKVQGAPANPVVFPTACRDELAVLQGDSGGRQLLDRQPDRVCYLPFASGEEFCDIDTPELYQRVVEKWLLGNSKRNR
jgi:molybdenum cofactor cytidylyltransferase